MLQLVFLYLNVFIKIDKLLSYAPLSFNLDFYIEMQDLVYLLFNLTAESPHLLIKFEKFNRAVIELIKNFKLIGFKMLIIKNKRSIITLL